MDPNVTLERIREAAETLQRAADHPDGYAEGMDEYGVDGLLAFCDVGAELAGLVSALDRWIAGGGFLPSSWDHEERRELVRRLQSEETERARLAEYPSRRPGGEMP